MIGIETGEPRITLRLIDAIQRTTYYLDIIQPCVEVEVLMFKSVLHSIARRELMLMLSADDDVPLRVTSQHIRHLGHRYIIVVDTQLAVGASKGYTRMERAARLESKSMVDA